MSGSWHSHFCIRPCARDPVGTSHQLDRVEGAVRYRSRLVIRQHPHFLRDMHAGERAFGREERLRILQCLACDRSSDLDGALEIALEHAPRPTMAGATLDYRDV